jgi:hydroxymethylpyrimidine pyrophosphatase-like HAD family hydrolase
MRDVDTAWIFDIDGVVTNPKEKKVKHPQILEHIANELKGGKPVAFNTRRSSFWLIERVINPLLETIQDRSILKNFIAVSEKGASWITFDKNGKMQKHKDNSISIPVRKGFATERILKLLKGKGIKPKQFIAFADSPSDVEMADILRENNLTFSFIFVDDKGQFKGRKHPFPIVYTKI